MIFLHRAADLQFLDDIEQKKEIIGVIFIAVVLIFILLFLRNFWNWIQKRRFRSKFNNVIIQYDKVVKKYKLVAKNEESLLDNIEDLKKSKVSNKKTFEQKEKEIEKQRKTDKEQYKKQIDNFNYERVFYEEKLKHTEVQASNTRLGAHFLKNVLGKIQHEYKKQSLGKFNLFGQVIIIEKKNKKVLLPIDILTKLNALLDYNVSTLETRKINVNDEINHIKSFLEIIKFLRPNLNIEHNFKNNYKNINISPTLFFPFLENALKHGDLNSDKSNLNIELINIKKSLLYRVTNTTYNLKDKENKQGFGLESLEKALDSYYENHELDLQQNGNEYVSELQVEL